MSSAPARVTTGTIQFVPATDHLLPAALDTTFVVLDTAWTALPGDRDDVVSAGPYLWQVIEQHDLFEEALAQLDGWARASGLADRLLVEGVTYWFRVRETLWHWLHERSLWRHTVAAMVEDTRATRFIVPSDEVALLDVLQLLSDDVRIDDPTGVTASTSASPAAVASPSAWRKVLGRLPGRDDGSSRATELARRAAILADRVTSMKAASTPRLVVLTSPTGHQHIGSVGGRRDDPHLGSVISKAADSGLAPIIIGMGVDPADDAGWTIVDGDPSMLPQALLRTRWSGPEDGPRAAAAVAGVEVALGDAGAIPLDVDGIDLGPRLLDGLRTSLTRTVTIDVHQLARIERFLAEVRPGAILLTQEGVRTPWLSAGAGAGIPVCAVQHGVLYPSHPGYADRPHPSLRLATKTFVYGDYERRVLVGGAYRPDEVEVSGSPRLDLDVASLADDARAEDARAGEREAVRAELGVASDDRMLVVSTLHTAFVRRTHLVHMLERTLAGPLPGVHVVFKQHPGEHDPGPYEALLTSHATAGGYAPPAMTVVKDIDLFRLLRAADAHLGQMSTVLTDAVAAGTPNLIAIVEGHADLLGYVAAGVARPVHSVDDVRAALADPRPADPVARRAFLDDHLRSGDASARIVASILRATTSALEPVQPAEGGER